MGLMQACSEEAAQSATDRRCHYEFDVIFRRRYFYSTLTLALASFVLNMVEYGTAFAEPQVLPQTSAELPAGIQLLVKYTINIPVRLGVTVLANMLSCRASLVLGFAGCMSSG